MIRATNKESKHHQLADVFTTRHRAAELSLVAKIGRECGGSNSTKRRALIIVTQDDWIRLTWIVSTMRSSIIYIQSRKQIWRRDGIVLLLLFLQLCYTRKRWDLLHVVSVKGKEILLHVNTEKCFFVLDWVSALTVICRETFCELPLFWVKQSFCRRS